MRDLLLPKMLIPLGYGTWTDSKLGRSTPARSPIPSPGRSFRRSTRSRRTRRTASAGCGAATSTRAAPTRRAPPCRSASPRSRRRGCPVPPGWRSPPGSPPRTPCCARSAVPATTPSSPTTRTAAPTGCSPRWRRRGAWTTHRPRSPIPTPSPRRSSRVARSSSGSRRRPTRCSASPTSPRSPTSRTRRAPSSSSTTPSPRRTCSSRCCSAPTSSCTAPPSTSAATATSSAARSSRPTPTSPSG